MLTAALLFLTVLTGREAIIYKEFANWDGWRQFTISEKSPETADGEIVSFSLKPTDGQPLPSFKPGQYVTVRLKIKGLKYYQLRQYSLSDAPRPNGYRITVKRDIGASPDQKPDTNQFGLEDGPPISSAASSASDSSIGSVRPRRPGLVSNALIDEFKEGDTVELTHPAGEFFLDTTDADNSPVVLISGGAGAAPLYSMLKTASEQDNNSRPISWIHASRHDALFREKVERIEKKNPNVKARFFRSRLADGDVISLATRFHEDFSAMSWDDLWLHSTVTQYFICGPEKFMNEIGNHLMRNGVKAARVRFELYSVGSFELKPAK
jgi:nitric oxide dioxygenase